MTIYLDKSSSPVIEIENNHTVLFDEEQVIGKTISLRGMNSTLYLRNSVLFFTKIISSKFLNNKELKLSLENTEIDGLELNNDYLILELSGDVTLKNVNIESCIKQLTIKKHAKITLKENVKLNGETLLSVGQLIEYIKTAKECRVVEGSQTECKLNSGIII